MRLHRWRRRPLPPKLDLNFGGQPGEVRDAAPPLAPPGSLPGRAAPAGAAELAARLPDPEILRGWCLSMAALDAVISPEWEDRYFSYDPRWAPDEAMASMRNGSGDEYSITFTPAGIYVRGFAHESTLSPFNLSPPAPWPGLLEAVPEQLKAAAHESAFTLEDVPLVTVAVWRLVDDDRWHFAQAEYPSSWNEEQPDVDGAGWLFEVLDGDPKTYASHAEEFTGGTIPLPIVRVFFRGAPADRAMVESLNPGADASAILGELRSIGYPAESN